MVQIMAYTSKKEGELVSIFEAAIKKWILLSNHPIHNLCDVEGVGHIMKRHKIIIYTNHVQKMSYFVLIQAKFFNQIEALKHFEETIK